MIELHKNNDAYLKYHMWQRDYTVGLDHGFMCKLCLKLHQRNKKKGYYNSVSDWWSPHQLCRNNSQMEHLTED